MKDAKRGLTVLVRPLLSMGSGLLLRGEGAPCAGAERAADERGHDEHPEVLQGGTTGEDGGTDGTGRVDGSSGQVDADEVHQDQRKADGQTGEIARADLAVSRSEDHEHEEEGRDDLDEESAAETACIRHAVGTETAGKIRGGDDIDEQEQDGTGEQTADHLADPIAAGVLPAHAPGEGDTEGDGRIDVAAGNAADGVSHGDDGETECEGRTDNTGGRVASEEDCGAAAQECQNEGSDALSDVLFHNDTKLIN